MFILLLSILGNFLSLVSLFFSSPWVAKSIITLLEAFTKLNLLHFCFLSSFFFLKNIKLKFSGSFYLQLYVLKTLKQIIL